MRKALQFQATSINKSFKIRTAVLAICIGLGLGVNIQAHAKNVTPPALRGDAPNVYVVKKGDTLWGISGRFLQKPWRWPEIWASNKHVRNPHLIYPGDRLLLCTKDGRTLIGKDEGDGCEGIFNRAGVNTKGAQIHVESLNHAIPVIPLDDIQVWLERSIILSPNTLQSVPYVLGMTDHRVIAAEGDRVYIRGNGIEIGQRYAIYREGKPYTVKDEKNKDIPYALELLQVGSAVATQQQGDISTFEISKTYNNEIRKGDYILPIYDPMLPTLFYPTSPNEVTAGGQVIRVLGSIGTAGKHSVVALNRGQLDGVQTGDIFALDQLGEVTTDPKTKETVQLPNMRVGHALVFRTFDNISYAYVTDTTSPVKVGAILSVPLSTE